MANPRARSAMAIGRSIDVYYRDVARTRRMDALNRLFVPRGGLAFDIGAHLGDRTGSFLRLGARVVALEPQPRVFRALRLLQGRAKEAVLLPWAVGAREAEVVLHLNGHNPTVATVAPEFIKAASGAEGWQTQVWDGRVLVPMTTLDALIARYGRPDFIKIDVEGHESQVLAGLRSRVAALSFEFTTIQRSVAHDAIDRVCALGSYRFNLSLGETHALVSDDWTDARGIHARLDALPDAANSGDVYARLS